MQFITASVFCLCLRFQPGFHSQSAFFCHGKSLFSFDLAFFIAEDAMPVLGGNGTVIKIHFLRCGHLHIGNNLEPKHAAGTGEGILHGKCMEGWNKNIRHIIPPSTLPFRPTACQTTAELPQQGQRWSYPHRHPSASR